MQLTISGTLSRWKAVLPQDRPNEVPAYLIEALALGQAQQAQAQIALTHRFLAVALLATNGLEAAKFRLQHILWQRLTNNTITTTI